MSTLLVDPLSVTEQLAIVDEFSAELRHGLRNGLATIRNAVFYNKRRVQKTSLVDEDPRVVQFFEMIEETAGSMGAVLQEGSPARLAFVKPPQTSDSAAVVKLAASYARIAKDRGIRLEISGEPVGVDGDETELAVAVRALIENAAEATPEGGRVRVAALVENARAVIEVSDEGPGFAEPAQAVKPFYTTKANHLGLGLCIARRTAIRFGGELSLVGGRGLVRLLLPRRAP